MEIIYDGSIISKDKNEDEIKDDKFESKEEQTNEDKTKVDKCESKEEQTNETKSNKENANEIKSENEQVLLLDESDDLEIVFESCSDIKPKQLNGQLNKPKSKEEKVENTPKKSQSNQQVTDDYTLNEFTFEIPQELCGLLIGTKKSFINNLMRKTNTQIFLKQHPTVLNLNLCSIKGHYNGINEALAIIRNRFPLKRFPELTLVQTPNNLTAVEPISTASQLHLPGLPGDRVSCDVILSDFLTPDHLFLQQPSHPTFNLLQRLDEYMITTYQYNDTPSVEDPVVGIICAVQRDEGWFRAIVTNIDQDNCTVRLLDYGGFYVVPRTGLRQVKRDYMSVPFQAVECFLANVEPMNGVWSQEANNYFREIAQKQLLQSIVVDYTVERIPKIHLYRIVNNQAVLINEELCISGFANWIN